MHGKWRDSPDFVQIPPELHLSRIGTELGQVPPQEHLSSLDLWAVLGVPVVYVCGLIGGISCDEGTSGDVLFQELFVDNVDDGRDQSLDVLGACG